MSHEHDNEGQPEIEGIGIDELEETFKHLAAELKGDGSSVSTVINNEASVEVVEDEPKEKPFFSDYEPGIMDFLARANTVKECEEIIEYCLKKGDISPEQANELTFKLHTLGPDVFGTRKPGYYDSKRE